MPISKSSNHTRSAAHELRQRIVSGAIPGGTRLFEVALAADLGISRTPVREAMARLAEEGLLERLGGGGFSVRSFSLRDMIDAIELRGVLEGMAARMAAEQGPAPAKLSAIRAVLAGLDRCFDTASGAVDFDRYSDLNADFHDILAEMCGSAVLLREIERVKLLPFASPSAFVMDGRDTSVSHHSLITGQEQHRAIVEAIARREGSRAEALAREHARIARANLERVFRDQEGDAHPVAHLALAARWTERPAAGTLPGKAQEC